MRYKLRDIIGNTTIICFILLILILILNASPLIINPGDQDIQFIVGNETYTFVQTMDFSSITISSSYIVFNNTGFYITSENDITISLFYLDDDISGADDGDMVLEFYADTTGGNVLFDISGFPAGRNYIVKRDGSIIATSIANSSGFISFSNDVWSEHLFGIFQEGEEAVASTTYYRKITINHDMMDEDLTNFPILVYTTDLDTTHVQDDGDDIQFWSLDNTTHYNHEIESYSSGTLYAWVNIPLVSSSIDTELWMKYGNTTCGSQEHVADTWDNNFKMVQHLNEAPANDVAGHLDSTSNSNDGTPKNFGGTEGSTTDATGKIAGCDDFDGNDDYIECPDFDLGTNDWTISGWIHHDTAADFKALIAKGTYNDAGDILIYDLNNNGGRGYMSFRNDHSSGDDIINIGDSSLVGTGWRYVIVTREGTTINTYLDGAFSKTGTIQSNYDFNNAHHWTIGAREDGTSAHVNAAIDEIRISDVARSSSWIKASYNTANSPGTFLSIGSEQPSEGEGDSVSPEISDVSIIWSDPKDTENNFGWENITCTVTDNVDVAEVSLNITYPDSTQSSLSMNNIGGTDQYYYNMTLSQHGNYNYYIWAKDTSDNQDSTSSYDLSLPPNWDIDMNGECKVFDLTLISNHYGETGVPGWTREDVDNNGKIAVLDLVLISGHYGETWEVI